MFLLLTRILLWLAVIGGIGYLVAQIVPKPYVNYVGYTLAALLLVLTFFEPTNGATIAAWQVFTLPFKPFGLLTIFLLNSLRGNLGSPEGRKQLNTIVSLMLLCSLSYFPRVFCQTIVERDAYALQRVAIDDPPGIPEAIVLLGWQTTEPSRLAGRVDQLSQNGDLVLQTANLYLQGQAPRVIISAGPRFDHVGGGKPPIEAYAISRLLQRLGVPENDIIIDKQGMDVRSSARNVAKLMESFGLPKDIVLVSTAISSYRAMQAFYEFDMVVAPRPAGYRTNQPGGGGFPFPNGRELLPTVEGMEFTTALTDEFLSSIYYFLRGWLSPGDLTTNQLRRAERSPAPSIATVSVPDSGLRSSPTL
jgi:uncharacterized SAM-binding protein YcdF (DUF218 family)